RGVVTVRDFGADAYAGDVLRQADAPKVDVALVDQVVDAAVGNGPRDERLRQLVRKVAVVKTERAVEPRRAPARCEAPIAPLIGLDRAAAGDEPERRRLQELPVGAVEREVHRPEVGAAF